MHSFRLGRCRPKLWITAWNDKTLCMWKKDADVARGKAPLPGWIMKHSANQLPLQSSVHFLECLQWYALHAFQTDFYISSMFSIDGMHEMDCNGIALSKLFSYLLSPAYSPIYITVSVSNPGPNRSHCPHCGTGSWAIAKDSSAMQAVLLENEAQAYIIRRRTHNIFTHFTVSSTISVTVPFGTT